MFCRYCGKEIEEDSSICWNCGEFLTNNSDEDNKTKKQDSLSTHPNFSSSSAIETDKAAYGVLTCIFLGLIGLVIGVLIYPDGSFRRKTFLKGWLITFIVIVGIYLFILTVGLIGVMASSGARYYY